MMGELKALLIGVERDPKVVAAFRAALLLGVPIAVSALVAWLGDLTDPRWLWLPGIGIPLIRAVGEGVLDQVKKPHSNEANPPPVAGSGGPNPLN